VSAELGIIAANGFGIERNEGAEGAAGPSFNRERDAWVVGSGGYLNVGLTAVQL
jgi:hypothetical protein